MADIGRRGDPWLFAVEDSTVQLTWGRRGLGVTRLEVGDRRIEIPSRHGPDALVITDLEPASEIRWVDRSGWRRPVARTLPRLRGPELYRFATISDMHFGERSFGYRSTIVERPRPEQLHPERATRAALAELAAWGAEAVVIKGDITHGGKPRQWDRFADVLAGSDLPVVMIPGNHDTGEGYPREPKERRRPGDDPPDRQPPIPVAEARSRLGLEPVGPVQVLDVPGLRILALDTTVPGKRVGQLGHLTDEVAQRAAEAGTAVFVAVHHQLLNLPVAHHPPPGIPARQSRAFLDRLQAANPAAFVSSGHTHRHRRRMHGTIVLTEVGSPKDYPGTWAGYVVHEGGIRQVVRRVAAPDVLAWTDRTASAALGAWGRWSPGTLDDRCFAHVWPTRR